VRALRTEHHEAVLERMHLKAQLQRAIDHKRFALSYQPLMDLESGAIVGIEALLRWNHPSRGLVPTHEFISLAEESGLIVPLGRWVLSEATRHGEAWNRSHPEAQITLAVNLSPRQIQDPQLVEDVKQALGDSGLDPTALMLEITENVLMHDMHSTVARLRQLKGLGVRIAVDDFGTGYSSLSYLRHLPIDVLKIARPFIDGLGHDAQQSALAEVIMRLGSTLNLITIAEGIETAAQWERLRDLGCDVGQGFFLCEPLSAEEMAAMLATRRATHGDDTLFPHARGAALHEGLLSPVLETAS
jgi:EAL domain-containing protein (putative c-di-GMP-specific phosphodiesterase class I)